MDLKEMGINMSNWVDSAQDRDYWRALLDVALNIRFHKPLSELVNVHSILVLLIIINLLIISTQRNMTFPTADKIAPLSVEGHISAY